MLVFLVLLLTPISGISIDLYTPSLPYIVTHFGTTATMAQLTVPVYLLGYGLSQSLYGSLSDRFGRRSPLIIGLVVYVIASLMVPQSSNIYVFLLMRLLQGVGTGGPGVLSKSILSDRFKGMKLKRLTNYMTMAWAMGPIVAPAVGGYLQAYYGWHASFYGMAGLGFVALLLVVMFLPEMGVSSNTKKTSIEV